jgi:hypothetical protein
MNDTTVVMSGHPKTRKNKSETSKIRQGMYAYVSLAALSEPHIEKTMRESCWCSFVPFKAD